MLLRRKIMNVVAIFLCLAATLITLVPLITILYQLFSLGITHLNWAFFTQLPRPVGEPGGGMANAIWGSVILITIAFSMGTPLGILGGIYLSEFAGKKTKSILRFMVDLLNGTPSIVIGIFIYAILVVPMRHFSALAGGIALGLMMIPTVVRSTEESLKMVPQDLREGGLALGLPYWRVIVSIVLQTSKSGIVTGLCLAVARIAGETAPLLFTALGNQFWSSSLTQPIAAMPLQIFIYASSPFDEWQSMAWTGAFVLIMLIVVLNIVARLVISKPNFGRKK